MFITDNEYALLSNSYELYMSYGFLVGSIRRKMNRFGVRMYPIKLLLYDNKILFLLRQREY